MKFRTDLPLGTVVRYSSGIPVVQCAVTRKTYGLVEGMDNRQKGTGRMYGHWVSFEVIDDATFDNIGRARLVEHYVF